MGGHSYNYYRMHRWNRIEYTSSSYEDIWTPLNILIVLSALTALVYLWITYVIASSDVETTLGLSETRMVEYLPFLTSSIELMHVNLQNETDSKDDIELMRFKKLPPLTSSDNWVSNENISLAYDDHYYWSWYFNSRSLFSVAWQYPANVSMYLMKGIPAYDAYYDKDPNLWKFITHKVERQASGNFSVRIFHSDVYFLIVDNGKNSTGDVNISIHTTLYDLNSTLETCRAPCKMNIGLFSDDVFVLRTPTVTEKLQQGRGSANSEYYFEQRHGLRSWLITTVVAVVLFGTYFCACFLARPTTIPTVLPVVDPS